MLLRSNGNGALLSTTAGTGVGLAGVGFVGVGLWARREVRRALAQERIVSTPDAPRPNQLVTTGAAAKAMAELIRRHTVEATAGRTYAEIDPYLDGDGEPTGDREQAATDDRTGQPVQNPQHALWVQSTTLQAALMQAYMASRLAELTVALGAAFVTAGLGLTAAARRH